MVLEEGLSEEGIIKKGFESKTVKWVTRAIQKNEYKRRQAPPILRVTDKAWFGRRMPITNRFES